MNKRTVRNLALKNGFKLKEQLNGKLDLNSYVYHFANELVKCQQQEMDSLKAQLAQYQSDDYVLVPKEPTDKMIKAGENNHSCIEMTDKDEVKGIYKAMIESQEKDNAKP